MVPIKVACAQFAPQKANLSANLDRIAETVIQAAEEGVQVVVFPETSTSGYFLEGGVLEASLSGEALRDAIGERVAGKISNEVDAVVGFYENRNGDLYNSAAYLTFGAEKSNLVHVYRKFFLATYGVFDEERFVTRGHDVAVFDTRFGRVGILICEDVWHGVLPTLCAVRGAQVLFVPAASPARGFGGPDIGNHDRYRRLFLAISEEHGIFCVNAQLTGFEGGKGFIGGSMVTDPLGSVVAEGPLGEEYLLVADLDMDLVGIARAQTPLINDLQSCWQDVRNLISTTEF